MQIQSISGANVPPAGPELTARSAVPSTEAVPQSNAKPVETMTSKAVTALDSAEQAEQAKKAVDKLNKVVASLGRGIEFTIDDSTKIRVVKVIDTQSKEVIRQLPSEDVVAMAEWMDKFQGLLLRDTA